MPLRREVDGALRVEHEQQLLVELEDAFDELSGTSREVLRGRLEVTLVDLDHVADLVDEQRDGPVVVEVPPGMLGGFSDLWQKAIVDIGITGADQGKGGRFLLVPPDFQGKAPDGYFVAKSETYGVVFGVRGFQVDGKPDKAAALMKTLKVYRLAEAASPPATSIGATTTAAPLLEAMKPAPRPVGKSHVVFGCQSTKPDSFASA